MRLFIVGSDKIYAIENFYVKYLRELGVEVFHFPAQSMFYDYYQKSMLNKLTFRSGFSIILNIINKKFKKEVEQFQPDIVWVFKGMEILPESLRWAKSKNIKLVSYNGDSPFIFTGKGSGNKNVTDSIPLYDLFLTYSREDKKIMETRYKIRSEILPFGFNLEETLYKECVDLKEIKRVCFLGNPDKHRGVFLDVLASRNVKIDVYGNNWNQFINHANIKAFNPVYGDEFWKVMRKYRVQLNLMRPHNPTTHNMRSFEAAGVGAIQLAPWTSDHQLFFKETEEIFLYKDVKTCYDQIEWILNLSDKEALSVRTHSRARSIKCRYTYKDRSAQALKFFKKLNP